MTYYSNYHAYRKFSWKKVKFIWIADALLKPNTNNSLEKDGFKYIESAQGHGYEAISKSKHLILTSNKFLSFIKKLKVNFYKILK